MKTILDFLWEAPAETVIATIFVGVIVVAILIRIFKELAFGE